MEVIKGKPAFPGIAIGRIVYYNRGDQQMRRYLVENTIKEQRDFEKAAEQAGRELEDLYVRQKAKGLPEAEATRRRKELLDSGSFRSAVESLIATEKVNASYAVMTNARELSRTFRSLESPVVQERIAHVNEISVRLLRILGGSAPRIDLGDVPVILVAETLTPDEIVEMDKEKLLAVVMHQGSAISHAAIMAKTMEIPALLGIETNDEWQDLQAIVDGYTGTMYLDPSAEVLKEYEMRRQADVREREELLKLRDKPDVTADGKLVQLYANVGNLADLNNVLFYGAAGIGLLRSEFQYLGRAGYPDEEELYTAYKKTAETMGSRIVVIRTADLGVDKQAPYMKIPDETNPIIGNRGIRFCLDHRDVFRTQLRAIYRASVHGNLAMMYPMISSEKELDEIEELIREVKSELRQEGILYRDIQTGIMIETPAAVLISRELAKRVDFLSLGTNDLTQYTLAMDRQNPLLYHKYDDHHPAVMRMIRMVIEAGHAEGCRICICGEVAADTALTETFLRMGVDALSVVPACILPVRKALRETDLRRPERTVYETEQ